MMALSLPLCQVPHSSRSACGWFCQARAAQQGQTRVTLGSLAHPSVLRPHSRLCSAAPAPQAVQRCSVTRLWHRGPAKPISRSARFSARLLHGLGKEALEGLHQILGGPRLHKPPSSATPTHLLLLLGLYTPGLSMPGLCTVLCLLLGLCKSCTVLCMPGLVTVIQFVYAFDHELPDVLLAQTFQII